MESLKLFEIPGMTKPAINYKKIFFWETESVQAVLPEA